MLASLDLVRAGVTYRQPELPTDGLHLSINGASNGIALHLLSTTTRTHAGTPERSLIPYQYEVWFFRLGRQSIVRSFTLDFLGRWQCNHHLKPQAQSAPHSHTAHPVRSRLAQ